MTEERRTDDQDAQGVPGEGLDNVGAEDADTSDGDPQSERAEK